jgi:hypothetical protein
VLKRSIVTRHDNSNYGNDDLKEELALSAVRVAAGEFSKLLFCRVTVHSRVHYKERVEELAEGRFNGRNGWSFEPSEIPKDLEHPVKQSSGVGARQPGFEGKKEERN